MRRPVSGVALSNFVHGLALAATDDDVLDIVMAFLEDGLAAGEPVLASIGNPVSPALRAALDHRAGLDIVEAASPVTTLDRVQEYVADQIAAGAERVRVVHLPATAVGAARWEERCRCEAVSNVLLGGLPVLALCVYATTDSAGTRLADLLRTHPTVPGPDGGTNRSYQPPERFLAERLAAYHEPADDPPALAEITDPTPAVTRAMVRPLIANGPLDDQAAADLLVATSEVVTNALVHGRPPVTVQIRCSPGGVTITVHDRGTGPSDPLAGFQRPDAAQNPGGLGLWLARRLSSLVEWRDEIGYSVRLHAETAEGDAPAI